MPEENALEIDMPEVDMPGLHALIVSPGDAVPTVDAADIKSLWNYHQELNAQHPEGSVAIGIGLINQICSPGADIRSVSYRCGMLGLLGRMLESAWPGGRPSEAAFKVAARMELKWMGVGVVQKGMSFDVEGFLAEVQAESMSGGALAE